MISVILFKMGKQLLSNSGCMTGLYSCHKSAKKMLRVLGDAVSQLETFVWILNHISRSITWSLFTLRATYSVKWPISTWTFKWWSQFIDWLKFESRPSSLRNFGTANKIGFVKELNLSMMIIVIWFAHCNVQYSTDQLEIVGKGKEETKHPSL